MSLDVESEFIIKFSEVSKDHPSKALYFAVPLDGKIYNLPSYIKNYVKKYREMDFLYTQMMSRNDGVYEITILNSRKQALEDWGITKQSYMRHLREMGEDESVAVTYVNDRYPRPTF
jgi:hypothetical protein